MVLLEDKTLGLELLLPTKLERYVEDIKWSDDLLTDIQNSKQKKKKDKNLKEYNEKIIKSISDLL